MKKDQSKTPASPAGARGYTSASYPLLSICETIEHPPAGEYCITQSFDRVTSRATVLLTVQRSPCHYRIASCENRRRAFFWKGSRHYDLRPFA